jgi:hypothetical protein
VHFPNPHPDYFGQMGYKSGDHALSDVQYRNAEKLSAGMNITGIWNWNNDHLPILVKRSG